MEFDKWYSKIRLAAICARSCVGKSTYCTSKKWIVKSYNKERYLNIAIDEDVLLVEVDNIPYGIADAWRSYDLLRLISTSSVTLCYKENGLDFDLFMFSKVIFIGHTFPQDKMLLNVAVCKEDTSDLKKLYESRTKDAKLSINLMTSMLDWHKRRYNIRESLADRKKIINLSKSKWFSDAINNLKQANGGHII